jgi:hypothetical protein
VGRLAQRKIEGRRRRSPEIIFPTAELVALRASFSVAWRQILARVSGGRVRGGGGYIGALAWMRGKGLKRNRRGIRSGTRHVRCDLPGRDDRWGCPVSDREGKGRKRFGEERSWVVGRFGRELNLVPGALYSFSYFFLLSFSEIFCVFCKKAPNCLRTNFGF